MLITSQNMCLKVSQHIIPSNQFLFAKMMLRWAISDRICGANLEMSSTNMLILVTSGKQTWFTIRNRPSLPWFFSKKTGLKKFEPIWSLDVDMICAVNLPFSASQIEKAIATWNPKQLFINGCFNWMIPNLYIENGFGVPGTSVLHFPANPAKLFLLVLPTHCPPWNWHSSWK